MNQKISNSRSRLALAAALVLTLNLSMTACNRSPNKSTSSPTGASTSSSVPDGAKCADGSAPKRLEGSCEGHWEVASQKDAAGKMSHSCNFIWKAVSCKGAGFGSDERASCYGTTTKPIEHPIKDTECAGKFGNPPQKFAYAYNCCS